jgi:hypothetical protein
MRKRWPPPRSNERRATKFSARRSIGVGDVTRADDERRSDKWLTRAFAQRDLEVVIDFSERSTELHVDCCRDIQHLVPPSGMLRRRQAQTARGDKAVRVDLTPEPPVPPDLSAAPNPRAARRKRGRRP